jgi:NTE family protein
MTPPHVSLVFAGGVALGAYQAGAYETLHQHRSLWPGHLSGSSVGAVNAALIAGNPPEQRVIRLREFWQGLSADPAPALTPWIASAFGAPWRRPYSWLSIMQTRCLGRPGGFRVRMPELALGDVTSVYDLEPLRQRLEQLVDFDLLNSGKARLSVQTTDVESGEAVVFDTAKGDRITARHLVASCGFLPEFPAVEIGGRLLGDGGLSANLPLEPALLDAPQRSEHVCFALDLFCAEGGRPSSLEQGAARRLDLVFGNQTRQQVRSVERELRLRRAQAGANGSVKLVLLRYRAPGHQGGPEKMMDFSRASLAERWQAGRLDMAEALKNLKEARTLA